MGQGLSRRPSAFLLCNCIATLPLVSFAGVEDDPFFASAVAATTAMQLDVRYCDPSGLPAVNCPLVEHGVDWTAMLDFMCSRCGLGQECQFVLPDDNYTLSLAFSVMEDERNSYACIHGMLACSIVTAQRHLLQTSTEMEAWMNANFSLAPFPFLSSQYTLHVNMLPVRLMVCDANLVPDDVQNRYILKAHPEDSIHCGMVFTDSQLVRRCRARRKMVDFSEGRPGEWLKTLKCPSGELTATGHYLERMEKYGERARSLQCQSARGMWNQDMGDVHKCVLITVAHWMNFRPGQLVLDWGSGCGHKLSWAKVLFDVDGLGVELMADAVEWARAHSMGKYCHADGRDLSWVPREAFDHVISYAALYHLPKADQCSTGIQLVSKLRHGGRAFFGWNRRDSMDNWEWKDCFRNAQRDHGIIVEMDAMEDAYLFPPDADARRGGEDFLHFLYQYPAYSMFLKRLA